MKVTPLDIRQQQFHLRFRGFDPVEVDTFLELVAGEVETLMKENARLRETLAKKDLDIQRMRDGEDELRKALTAIQEIKEDWIGRAEKQAERILTEAELKAKQVLMEAEIKLASIQHEVQEIKRRRHQVGSQIRGFLEEHLKLLDAAEVESENEISDDIQRPLLEVAEVRKELGGL